MSLQITLKKIFRMLQNNEHSKAIHYCNNALEIYHNDADIISARGEAYFALGKLKEALLDLNEAAILEPRNPFRYSSRAFVKEKLGDTAEALEDYKKALEIDPTDATIQNNLGLLEEKLGYEVKAKKRFDIADELYQLDQMNVDPVPEQTSSDVPVKRSKEKGYKVIFKVFTDKAYRSEFFKFLSSGLRAK